MHETGRPSVWCITMRALQNTRHNSLNGMASYRLDSLSTIKTPCTRVCLEKLIIPSPLCVQSQLVTVHTLPSFLWFILMLFTHLYLHLPGIYSLPPSLSLPPSPSLSLSLSLYVIVHKVLCVVLCLSHLRAEYRLRICGLDLGIDGMIILIWITEGWAKWSILLTQYCAGDKIEKNEMGWACGAYGWGEGGV